MYSTTEGGGNKFWILTILRKWWIGLKGLKNFFFIIKVRDEDIREIKKY